MVAQDQSKLETLMELEGFDDETEFLAFCVADSIVPAICINEGCDYTAQYEPDQDAGYCEECGTNTVKSALILAGII